MEYLIIIGLVALAIFGFVNNAKERTAKNEVKESFLYRLKALPDYAPQTVHNTADVYFGIDAENQVVCYATAPGWTPLLVNAEDILSVSIYEDGRSVSHASRPRQVGGALVGNALGGSAGAIIGGLGTKQTTVEMINNITLRLEIDVPEHPICDVVFLSINTRRDGPLYKSVSANTRSFSSQISALIRSSSKQVEGSQVPPMEDVIIRNLTSLAALQESGALTDEEYLREKSRILGTTPPNGG